ncbi:proliferating cell nuclear antigen 2-like [Capsella rubella]|uniref:proliferating cell nuclear antigen 2-like n=1 Tax=Capsella rubella TaxID=81985 RepID=UPI000CD5BC50|nr:proliferating cell nuclear antigen 2-like [Capsella rubella]
MHLFREIASRCDRRIFMMLNLGRMSKLLNCAQTYDIVTIKADGGSDTVTFMFESPTQAKIAVFETKLKLMDIVGKQIRVPEYHSMVRKPSGEFSRICKDPSKTVPEYHSIVRMPSGEFSRICKDLSSIGDTVVISVMTKEVVRFSTEA